MLKIMNFGANAKVLTVKTLATFWQQFAQLTNS
jgi:hypothetical protein